MNSRCLRGFWSEVQNLHLIFEIDNYFFSEELVSAKLELEILGSEEEVISYLTELYTEQIISDANSIIKDGEDSNQLTSILLAKSLDKKHYVACREHIAYVAFILISLVHDFNCKEQHCDEKTIELAKLIGSLKVRMEFIGNQIYNNYCRLYIGDGEEGSYKKIHNSIHSRNQINFGIASRNKSYGALIGFFEQHEEDSVSTICSNYYKLSCNQEPIASDSVFKKYQGWVEEYCSYKLIAALVNMKVKSSDINKIAIELYNCKLNPSYEGRFCHLRKYIIAGANTKNNSIAKLEQAIKYAVHLQI